MQQAFATLVTQVGPSNQTANNNTEQTVNCTHLCPSQGILGRHEFKKVNTWWVMNQQTTTAMLITDTVIAKTEEMSKKQGTTEVKFHDEDATLNL